MERDAAVAFKILVDSKYKKRADADVDVPSAPGSLLSPEKEEALLQTLDCLCATASIQSMRRVFALAECSESSSGITASYLARQFGRCDENDTSD